jgi:uncharacterized membrane protein
MYKTLAESKNEVKLKLTSILIAIVALLFFGTIFYHFAEGWSFIDALYFSAISLTSRGFSEMRPTNWFSVLVTIVYLFMGLGLIIYAISSLVSYYSRFYEEKVTKAITKIKEKRKKKKVGKWFILKHST